MLQRETFVASATLESLVLRSDWPAIEPAPTAVRGSTVVFPVQQHAFLAEGKITASRREASCALDPSRVKIMFQRYHLRRCVRLGRMAIHLVSAGMFFVVCFFCFISVVGASLTKTFIVFFVFRSFSRRECGEKSYSVSKGSIECERSKKGENYVSASSVPLLCEAGTYGSAPGVCSECGGKNYSVSKGSIACKRSKQGENYVSASSVPLLCEVGTYGSAPGVCSECGGKNYSVSKGSIACKRSKQGENYVSATSDPLLCEAGTYGSAPGVCSECPENHYTDNKGLVKPLKVLQGMEFVAKNTKPRECDVGTRGSAPGVCTACTNSTYQLVKGQTTCKTVGLGFKFVSAASEPVKCAAGKYGSSFGVCLSCTAGMFEDKEGSMECKSCPKGMAFTILLLVVVSSLISLFIFSIYISLFHNRHIPTGRRKKIRGRVYEMFVRSHHRHFRR